MGNSIAKSKCVLLSTNSICNLNVKFHLWLFSASLVHLHIILGLRITTCRNNPLFCSLILIALLEIL